MKTCLIHQPAGIGDVFFLQHLARKYIEFGYQVVWPLREDILWITDYIKDISFCSVNDDFVGKQYYGQDLIIISPDFVYLGVDKTHLWGVKVKSNIVSKYQLANIDYHNWKDGFLFDRNIEKENELYYDVLGLKDDSEYVYVNSYYNTDNLVLDSFVGKEFGYPIVENEILDGFTPFDWIKVWENAREIHTRATSISFIIDKLNIKSEVYYYYLHDNQYNDLLNIFTNVKEYIDLNNVPQRLGSFSDESSNS
jgi:hypothetical protein|tara:strand:+ start:2680 stop:3435 length:756 start_codon:yes stop_codon:yes gene_type:complete